MKRSLLIFALVLGGCATAPRDSGFSDVRETVLNRSSQTIEWRRGPADEARIHEMLSGTLTADEAVAVALANHPRLQMILSELGMARADLLDASTISNPIVEFEWRYPAAPYNPYEVSIAQAILDLVQLPRRRAAGRASFEAARNRVAADVLSFAAEVRDEYYALLAATRKVAYSATATEAARVAAELAVRQHTAGNITDLDLELQQATYEQAKVVLARDEEEVLTRREGLIRAMGLPDDAGWQIASDFPELPEREPEPEEISTVLAERRLDLLIATREAEALRRLLPASRLESIGEVMVDVHREREPSGEKTTGPGIEFPIPIFNRGAAARARAEAQLARAELLVNQLTITAGSEVRMARQRLLAARARVEYYRDVIVPRRTRIVELTKLEHNSMLIGIYQLLQARQNETQARREMADAQREYWAARNDFDRAVNGVGGMGRNGTEAAVTAVSRTREEGH